MFGLVNHLFIIVFEESQNEKCEKSQQFMGCVYFFAHLIYINIQNNKTQCFLL